MLLKQPNEIQNNAPISCLIYGQPGTGKTTAALSASKPALIDFDRGIGRVEARFRCPSLPVNNFKEVLDLLNSNELDSFDTIVIDTLGKCIDRIGDYVAKDNPKLKQGNGNLSMQGWGAVKIQFQNLLKLIASKNKSVIFVAHEKEDKDGDVRFVRPDVAGSSGKDIVKELDLMGYMEMKGNTRTISFSPTESHYAKNSLGLKPVIEIPNTDKGNTFFQDCIIAAVNARRTQESEMLDKYNALKGVITEKIATVKDLATLNEVFEELKNLEKIWDSEFFWKHELNTKASEIGATYDKVAKVFIQKLGA